MMTTTIETGYRSARTALEERIADARVELDGLRRPSAVQRAALSPATRRELAAVEPLIEQALSSLPSLEALTTLEAAIPRLAALLSRTDEELERALVRADARLAPVPAPPGGYLLWRKRTFSLARRCPDLLPAAQPHGVGLLAQLDHGGARVFLVAHGVHLLGAFLRRKAVECLLRTAAPRGPAFTVAPRGALEKLLSPRDAIAIAPDFDDAMIVRGQAAVARAVLDARLRGQLLAMRRTLRALFVGDGFVDLAWTQPLPDQDEAFPRESELALTTAVAQRIRETVAAQSAQ